MFCSIISSLSNRLILIFHFYYYEFQRRNNLLMIKQRTEQVAHFYIKINILSTNYDHLSNSSLKTETIIFIS